MGGVIKCRTWNVNGGLENKLSNKKFQSYLLEYDICILLECWISEHSNISLDGYNAHAYHRRKRINNRTQGEGIVILIKDTLSKNVKIKEILYDTIVWIHISKEIVTNHIDLYIAAVYIPPSDSKFHDIYDCDLFTTLNDSITKYTELGNMLITGDFNARTGALLDYIDSDGLFSEINNHISEVMSYIPDTEPGPRSTMDRKINTFGRKLINLCKSSLLRIVNGRHKSDPTGSYTYCGPNGRSVVDLVLTNSLSLILHFKVNDLTEFSDHSPVDFSIQCTFSDNCLAVNAKI